MRWKSFAAAPIAVAAIVQLAHGQSANDTNAPAPSAPAAVRMPDSDVVGSTPLLGAGVAKETVPAPVQVLTPQDINRTGVPSLTGTLDTNLPSVHLSDASGNPFQPDILFRGFTASPVEGETQGLAVYVNGARFNTPFGDTVNWDLIPSNAIAQVNVEGANPVFGLNALGGSVNVKLKDGFSYHGGDLTSYAGSYGRAAAMFQYGAEFDNTSAYVATNYIHDDSWRHTGGSEVRQVYTDLGWRRSDSEVHLSITGADNRLGNPGATPEDLLSVDRGAASTAPNFDVNNYLNVNLRGTYDINDTTSVQAVLYWSNFHQTLFNGVTVDGQPCTTDATSLCGQDDNGVYDSNFTTPAGANIPSALGGVGPSGLTVQTINSNAYGASAQVSNDYDVFGHNNHLVLGASVDAAQSNFSSNEYIGGLSTDRVFLQPSYLSSDGQVNLHAYNQYYGVFFTDRFDVTDQLALSLSGRFNLVDTAIHDLLGLSATANNQYERFNPGVGLTYRVLPQVTLFANYSEANRAPTPNESECSNVNAPCQLPNAFLSDPPLKQVVARTFEAGFRGRVADMAGGRLTWDADAFHTENTDDLIFQYDQNSSAGGYYTNSGKTLREGFEANVTWRGPVLGHPLRATLGYTYTDATYESAFTLGSPNNPGADPDTGTIQVNKGSRLPGVPLHKATLVVDYDVTDKLTIGGSLIASTSQFLYLDDANLTKPLGGFVEANINATYKVTDHVQVFGLVNNVTNQRYATYGTFAPVNLINASYTNTRVYSPAAPISAYGGLRVTF